MSNAIFKTIDLKILSLTQTTKHWTSCLGNISLFGTCNLSFAYLNQLAIWVFSQ